MLSEFEYGMGVMWDEGDTLQYGVIMDMSDGVLELTPIYPLENDTKCYDEGGAVESRDADHVRLKDVPPPFSILCLVSDRSGCFALASLSDRVFMSEQLVSDYGVSIVDDGEKVSDRDMSEILDHPWRDEQQVGTPDWQSFSQKPVQESIQPKRASSTAMDRLLAAISDNGDASREDGFDGPDF